MWSFVYSKLDQYTKSRQIDEIMINNALNNNDSSKANFFNAIFKYICIKA